MKRMLILLMFVLGMSINGFAQSETSVFETIKNEVINKVKEAPAGTIYGIIKSTPEKYVVNTPLGEYNIKKNTDGSFECLGITAKIISKKGNVYVVDSSLGKFKINTKKCTITKL